MAATNDLSVGAVLGRFCEDLNGDQLAQMLQYAAVYVIPLIAIWHFICTKALYPLVVRYCTTITDPRKARRFCENAYKTQHYLMSALALAPIALTHFSLWLSEELFDCVPDNLDWRSTPHTFFLSEGTHWTLTSGEIVYSVYVFQIGFYLYDAFRLVFVEERISDFYVMAFHHTVTIVLILLCAATCVDRLGVFIMFIHDVTDVPLYAMKITEYAGWRLVNTVFSAVFALGFILVRVVFQSYFLAQRAYYVGTEVPTLQVAMQERRIPVDGLVQLLLWVLLCCQLYWSKMIVSKGYRVLKRGEDIADVREEASERNLIPYVEDACAEKKTK